MRLAQILAGSVELTEGRRISMSLELAMKRGQNHTPSTPLVLMTFEQSCETRGDEKIDALQQVFSGQIFSTVVVPHNDPLLTLPI